MTPATPSVNRSARGTATAKSSSRRQVESVALIAARARAFAVRVPPTPATSISCPSIGPESRSAISAVMPYAADGTPPPIGLPTTTKSGSRPQALGAPTRPGAQRVRLVDDQQDPVAARDLADALEVAVVGQHDPDVGQRRLHQQAGDVALRQTTVEGVEVVERHDRGRHGDVDLRPESARAGNHAALVEHGEGLVDGAVVAPVHHRDPRPAGEVTGEAEHEPVRVGR